MYDIKEVDDLNNQAILFAVIKGLYTSAISDSHLDPYESVFGLEREMPFSEAARNIAMSVDVLAENHCIIDKTGFYDKLYNIIIRCYSSGISTSEFAKLFISLMEEDYCALSNNNWDNYIVPLFLTYMVSCGSSIFRESVFNQILDRGLVEDTASKELPADIPFREKVWGRRLNKSWKEAYIEFFPDKFFIHNPESNPEFFDATMYEPQTI